MANVRARLARENPRFQRFAPREFALSLIRFFLRQLHDEKATVLQSW